MIACPVLAADGPVTISDALKSVDCQSGQAVEIGFSRLFGDSGALGQALTLILTLYVALLALSLLTGRSQLRLNMLAPRMLQLGLVLTFATSWVAYQSVAWNLLVEAPDEVAGILLGTKGSASALFAMRLDSLFEVIANTAHTVSGANALPPTTTPVPQIAGASPHPSDLLWAASLLLLLGTVGVLIVARIALAAVMALGPIFIIFALFSGTRGLFEGWLKAAAMLALTPMFAVLLGGGTLVLIAPMIAALQHSGGKVSLELATSIFLASFIYIALMVLAMRAAAMIVNGWHLGGASHTRDTEGEAAHAAIAVQPPIPMLEPLAGMAAGGASDRMRGIVDGMSASSDSSDSINSAASSDRRTVILTGPQARTETLADVSGKTQDPRIRPLGQGFRAPNRFEAKLI